MNKIPRLISAVLTNDALNKLQMIIGKPKYSKIFMHHCTIAFKPTQDQFTQIEDAISDGDKVSIELYVRYWDAGVEAVTCSINKDNELVKIYNEHPHITISTDNLPPKESNVMLSRKNEIPDEQKEIFDFVELNAVIKYDY